jgi:hypothetical protein
MVNILYINNHDQVANIFTKTLPRDCFAKLHKLLGLHSVSQIANDSIKSMGVLSNIDATCRSVMSHVP